MTMDKILVTRAEFDQGMGEQVENIKDLIEAFNTLKTTVNTQAEVLGCHRFILEKFVPRPLLEQAAKEYKQQREMVIESELAATHGKAN